MRHRRRGERRRRDTARTPEDYGDAFAILGAEKRLPAALAAKLRLAAGMRNVLVHGYAEVDPRIVWTTLSDLDDLREFATVMRARLDDA